MSTIAVYYRAMGKDATFVERKRVSSMSFADALDVMGKRKVIIWPLGIKDLTLE